MKKILCLFILMFALLNINLARGAFSGGTLDIDFESLDILLVNQDPYPASQGEYVDVLFKLENAGTKEMENVIVELIPKYPFSFDSDEDAIKELGTVGTSHTDENAFLLKYKLRVDEDAVDGENEIKLKCIYGDGNAGFIETFDITIDNPRTDFDMVVQDIGDSTTLAIANIGKNTAYSVIMRIPEQENFKVTGPSGNVIGNLDAGDYTLASFQISPKGGIMESMDIGDQGENQETAINSPTESDKNLVVEISYTDTLGIRRTIQKEVKFAQSESSIQIPFSREELGFQGQRNSSKSLIYIGMGAIGIIVIVIFFKIKKRKKK